MAVEDICNEALDRIGYKRHIGHIYEGSIASRVLLDNYWQTRDELLKTLVPRWATSDRSLTLLRQAPQVYDAPWDATQHPPIGFRYEYAMPIDALEVLHVKSSMPTSTPLWRPKATHFSYQASPNGEVTIVTDVRDAVATCVIRVTNPERWMSDFRAMVVESLVRKIAPLLPQAPRRQEDADAANRRDEQGAQ